MKININVKNENSLPIEKEKTEQNKVKELRQCSRPSTRVSDNVENKPNNDNKNVEQKIPDEKIEKSQQEKHKEEDFKPKEQIENQDKQQKTNVEQLSSREEPLVEPEEWSRENSKIVEIEKKVKKSKGKKITSGTAGSNEDHFANYLKRRRNNKIKITLMMTLIIGSLVSLLGFNIYFTFFREVTPIGQLAYQVVNYAGISSFPKNNVAGYLDKNFEKLAEDAKMHSIAIEGFKIDNIVIDGIFPKGNSEANVYFTVKMSSSIGSSSHRFFLGLRYTPDGNKMEATTPLSLNVRKDNNTTDIDGNYDSIWSFDTTKKMTEEETKELASWLNNFFIILYNEKNDVSTFYDGSYQIGDENLKFENIENIKYYKQKNKQDCNVVATIRVSSITGCSYLVTTYMNIEKISNTFIVHYLY